MAGKRVLGYLTMTLGLLSMGFGGLAVAGAFSFLVGEGRPQWILWGGLGALATLALGLWTGRKTFD